MEALSITILFSVLLGLIFIAGFAWDWRTRAGDDAERESLRPLREDEHTVPASAKTPGR